jgi:hypothetical protein
MDCRIRYEKKIEKLSRYGIIYAIWEPWEQSRNMESFLYLGKPNKKEAVL